MTNQIHPERHRLGFLPGIAEKLGWYVYALRDPRDGVVFYVGKGVGNRAYDHALSAIAGSDSTLQPKRQLINAIHASGNQVIVELVRRNLPDERTAYEVEAAVIDALRYAGTSDLAVQIAGHGRSERGWASLEALMHLAAAPLDVPPEMRPCVLIRPRKKYSYSMSTDQMWEVTRGGWTFRHRPYKYAFCVHDGITRGIWCVTGWDPDASRWGRGRRGLEGEPALDIWEEFVGRDATAYLPTRGGQLPYTIVL